MNLAENYTSLALRREGGGNGIIAKKLGIYAVCLEMSIHAEWERGGRWAIRTYNFQSPVISGGSTLSGSSALRRSQVQRSMMT